MSKNLLTRSLFLLLIFAVFIIGYFYFNKTEPVAFKGCDNIQIVKISDETLELRGEMVFHNPNKMRAQIGKLDVSARLGSTEVGILHETFKTTIKGDENLRYPFQFRFPASVLANDTARQIMMSVGGEGGSDVLINNYNFTISYSGTVKIPPHEIH